MKLDPRARLLIIVLLTTLAVLAKDLGYLSIVVAAALLINLIFKLDIVSAIKRLKHFITLLIFITVVQSLTVKGGDPLISIANFHLLTTRGIGFALEFIMRMAVILLAGLIAAAAEGREMTDGLLKMHMPYELAFMAAIALRYLPVFRDEFANRINAIALRGIDIKRLSLSRKLKVYGYLITPAILGAMLRSEELARSMSARGFGAYKNRTMLRNLKLTYQDWLVIIIGVVLTAAYLTVMYTCGPLWSL